MTSSPRRYAGLLLLSAAVSLPAIAGPTPDLDRLASDPDWLRLLHYEADRSSPSGWRSAIHSEAFFLAGSDGASDPRAELAATITAMGRPAVDAPDDHPQCRFPARRQWLAERLGLRSLPPRPCPKYEGWTRSATVESVSIVFATGYLGNPASYYGHTLLKFNFARDDGRTRLQDASLNYGAILTGDDDPVSYILKGVFGGYEGGFSDIQYYFHDHNYGENELRDLWEYRLDLPPEAVALIVAHAWEVLGQRYDYYFFRRNCAFRMAEVVQVVAGLGFIPEDLPWTVPQALLQRLAASRVGGKPLVAEVTRYPSRQTRFYEAYRSLAADEADLLKGVVNGNDSLDGQRFAERPLGSKHAVLDGLIDYYQFVADPKERATGSVHPLYAQTLATRYRLAPGSRPSAPLAQEPPHTGRPPSWLQVGWLHGDELARSMSLRIRPAYYDALDTGSGHVPNAALSMGDLQLRIRAGRVRVQRLDLVAVESVNPGVTGLPGDRGSAWKLRLGAEAAHPGCTDCLVARLQGDVGMGRRLADGLFAAVYAGGAIQEDRADEGPGFVRASADVIVKPSARLGIRLGYEHRVPVDAPKSPYGLGHAEIRLALGSRSDLRVRRDWDEAALTTVGMGIYW